MLAGMVPTPQGPHAPAPALSVSVKLLLIIKLLLASCHMPFPPEKGMINEMIHHARNIIKINPFILVNQLFAHTGRLSTSHHWEGISISLSHVSVAIACWLPLGIYAVTIKMSEMFYFYHYYWWPPVSLWNSLCL